MENVPTKTERAPVDHRLKIRQEHFIDVSIGNKRAEFRRNDRDYRVGDTLILCEYGSFPWIDVEEGFSGEETPVQVTHITDLSEWAPGYVMLSISLTRCTYIPEPYGSFDDDLPF